MSKNNVGSMDLDDIIQAVLDGIDGSRKIAKIDVKSYQLGWAKLEDYSLDDVFTKTRIQYLGSYPTGIPDVNQLWFKRQGTIDMSTIRITPYANDKAVNNIRDPVNVNQILLQVLSELVLQKRTNNVLLPIINVDVKGIDLQEFDKVVPRLKPSSDLSPSRSRLDSLQVKPYITNAIYSISITERYYSLIPLSKFIEDNELTEDVLRSMIYQVIDVVKQITSVYPKFRYNQMVPEMIDCYVKKNGDVVYPLIKLSRFYLAEIKGLFDNVSAPSFVESNYSDIYQFLRYMWDHMKVDIDKYPNVVQFFDRAYPEEIRSDDPDLSSFDVNKIRDDPFFKDHKVEVRRVKPALTETLEEPDLVEEQAEKKSPTTDIGMPNNKQKRISSTTSKPKSYRGQRQLYQPTEQRLAPQQQPSLAYTLGANPSDYYQSAPNYPQQMPPQFEQPQYPPQQQFQQPPPQQPPSFDQASYYRYMAAMGQADPSAQQQFDPSMLQQQGGGGHQKSFFFR